MLPLDETAPALDQRLLSAVPDDDPRNVASWTHAPLPALRIHTVIFGAEYYGSVTTAYDLWAFAQ
jgi:hypothetical protein